MIKKVTLKNFQAHKNLEVELGKFTTLTGGSNGGKSAVLRAILALSRNDSANDYLRHGQKTLSVKIEFEDGNAVEWIKGSGENKYIITAADGGTQEFDKVGANVPEEVQEVLKFGPLLVGKDKHFVNFHQQLESPFLISATPGDVAKLFGELTSASQLYSAVNEGNRGVRATNAQKKTRMGDLRQVKIDLEDFEDVEQHEQDLEAVKTQLERAKKYEAASTEISKIVQDVTDAQETIDTVRLALADVKVANNVNLDELIDAGSKAARLDETIKGIDTLNGRLEKGRKGEKLLAQAVQTDLTAVQEAARTHSKLAKAVGDVVSLARDIDGAREKLEALEAQMEKDAARYNELIEQVEACPWCDSELSEETKAALLGKVVTHAH